MSEIAAVKSPIGLVVRHNIANAQTRDDDPDADPRFNVTLAYPAGTNLDGLKAIANAAAVKKFPQGIPEGLRSPFKLGEEKRKKDGNMPAGIKVDDIVIEFWRYEKHGRVPCVDTCRHNKLLETDIYSGMLARVIAQASGYDVKGNVGVSLHLEALQKAGDGEPLGSAKVDPATAFDDIEGAPGEAVVSSDPSSLF